MSRETDRLVVGTGHTAARGPMGDFVEPPTPPPPSLFTRIIRPVAFTVISFVAVPIFCYLVVTKFDLMSSTWRKMQEESIKKQRTYKDEEMTKRLWASTKSGQLYAKAVEYQQMEGYCCNATQRSILKSVPSVDATTLQTQKRGPATIQKFADGIDEMSGGKTKSTVVLGSEGYDAFLATLKRVNDPKVRIAANFLRSPLFGINPPAWLPFNLLISFFGGHFSPGTPHFSHVVHLPPPSPPYFDTSETCTVVGFFDEVNLVAVFDVNHNYSLFFVTPERLFEAVNTFDVTSGKGRGLVVVEVQ